MPAVTHHVLSSHSLATTNAVHQLDVQGFNVGDVIGTGSYATVRKVWSRAHRCHFAVKSLDVRRARADYTEHFMPRELHIVRALRHPNVLRVVQIVEQRPHVMIVCEWCENGDLLQKVRRHRGLDDKVAKHHMRHIMEGVGYLHEQHIAHRDIKCENVLLDKHDNAKLADFGFARVMDNMSRTYCGSRAYAPPEILQARPYDGCQGDIWSAGVVLFIMLTGCMPFDERNTRRMVQCQFEHRLQYPSRISRRRQASPSGRSLVRFMMAPEAADRPSVAAVCRHDYLADTQWRYRTDDTIFVLRPAGNDGGGGGGGAPPSSSSSSSTTSSTGRTMPTAGTATAAGDQATVGAAPAHETPSDIEDA